MVALSLGVVACGGEASLPESTPAPTPTVSVEPATVVGTPAPSPTPEPLSTPGSPTPQPPSTLISPTPTTVGSSSPENVRFVLVPERSEARYRVREQLVNQPLPNDAVGTTRDVSGVVVLTPDGRIVAEASRFEVDLRTLRSDQSRRDAYIQRNTLDTAQYPTAVFVPREAGGLPWPLPASGEFTFQLHGDLTIHGVTKPVTWEVAARREGDGLVGRALTQVTFQDFGMEQPRVAIVLSVEETIQLELDFTVAQE